MNAAEFEGLGPDEQDERPRPGRRRRKTALHAASLVLWVAVLSLVAMNAIMSPSVGSIATAVAFATLFSVIYAQILLLNWAGHHRYHQLNAKLKGAGYISSVGGLPNRNYLLAELRREMPRARKDGMPFTLLVLSLEKLDEVKQRRGEDFVDRALYQMVETLRRATRNCDFLAHLGDGRFSVLLVDCVARDSLVYLERLPGSVAVSDGRHMYDVPITARLVQYDLESLYATDVLADAETARPLQRKAALRQDIRVA